MSWQTVPELAAELGVDEGKILGFIKRGELAAVNLAHNAGGRRPRWRISGDAKAAFLAARTRTPPAPPQVRRKREAASVTKYF